MMKMISGHAVTLLLLVFCANAARNSQADFALSQGFGEKPITPPSVEERDDEMFQCDRQCRWYFGYFSEPEEGKNYLSYPRGKRIAASSIVGKRVGRPDRILITKGNFCQCFQKVIKEGQETLQPLGDRILRYTEKKKAPTDIAWTGTDTTGWNTAFVCVETKDGPQTMTENFITEGMGTPLHCGACSACSSRQDIEILSRTRQWITEVMTKVSTKFAAPWGHKNVTRLMNDLDKVDIPFSRTRWDGRTDLPSCMDVWADNIMCDAMTCKSDCWAKFFSSRNEPTQITGDPKFWQLNAKCLRCDELNCGPAFIKGAGANRRSSGIDSDIPRPDWQKCKHGLYSGVLEKDLPTDPKPDTKKIDL